MRNSIPANIIIIIISSSSSSSSWCCMVNDMLIPVCYIGLMQSVLMCHSRRLATDYQSYCTVLVIYAPTTTL